jgi:hydroxylaminobenzene mutase
MSAKNASPRLIWHGVFLFLLGLLTGVLIPALTSPRLGLAAHLEALLNGMFLVLVGGVVWERLRLPERVEQVGCWLLLCAAYASWGFCLLAAVFGAGGTLAIAGAGYSAAEWKEQLVSLGLIVGAVCITVACCLLLYGLRGGPAPGRDPLQPVRGDL